MAEGERRLALGRPLRAPDRAEGRAKLAAPAEGVV